MGIKCHPRYTHHPVHMLCTPCPKRRCLQCQNHNHDYSRHVLTSSTYLCNGGNPAPAIISSTTGPILYMILLCFPPNSASTSLLEPPAYPCPSSQQGLCRIGSNQSIQRSPITDLKFSEAVGRRYGFVPAGVARIANVRIGSCEVKVTPPPWVRGYVIVR